MKIFKIQNTWVHISNDIKEYYMITEDNFRDMFFNQYLLDKNNEVCFIDNPFEADIVLCGIQLGCIKKPSHVKSKMVMIGVENMKVHGPNGYYKHYNLFGHFGDSNINIYFYGDISKIIENEKYLAIPMAYIYIDQFIRLERSVKLDKYLEWASKKFCLFVSRSKYNNHKEVMIKELEKIGKVDMISDFNYLKNVSCYHGKELLELFNEYKFVICFENSFEDGYITEKIFNVFLAKSIPIYDGPSNIDDYLEKGSYLSFHDSELIKKIMILKEDKKKYLKIVNYCKISDNYDNEKWDEKFIKKVIN